MSHSFHILRDLCHHKPLKRKTLLSRKTLASVVFNIEKNENHENTENYLNTDYSDLTDDLLKVKN